MIVFKSVEPLATKLRKLKAEGSKISFVPTMGALHEGHLSLIKLGQETGDITVASIFVNPTQFNDSKDFEKYPVTTDQDIRLLTEEGVNILFLPSTEVVYPGGIQRTTHYDLGFIETILEGKFRPGHFQGVCQVIDRFLTIIKPDYIVLGQKDYQQCMVIKKLIALLELPTQVVIGPTLRETNGLAMSSRNTRLSEAQREQAATIYKALLYIKNNWLKAGIDIIKQQATQQIKAAGFESVDYIEIADATTLQPLTEQTKQQPAVALVAAFLGGVRLIDNMVL